MTGPSLPIGPPTGEPGTGGSGLGGVAGAGGVGGVPAQPVTLRVGLGGAAASGSLFDRIGGAPTFDRLVRRFYEGVQQDEVIWPMYPAEDLDGAIWRLSQFLQQYWGGPSTYSEQRGHPGCGCGTTRSTSRPRPASTGYGTCTTRSSRSASPRSTRPSCGATWTVQPTR